MKDMTTAAASMMTDEEKTEVEKQLNSGKPNGTSPSLVTSDAKSKTPPITTGTASSSSSFAGQGSTPTGTHDDSTTPATPTAAANPSTPIPSASDKERERREAARRKAEQREKLREHDKARRKVMEQRVVALTNKMIERLRPFVEAKDPGGKNDPESIAFEERMKREVEDLKLESFGVEVCPFLC